MPSFFVPHSDDDSVDGVVGALKVLCIASNTTKFKNWLREYHGYESFEDLLTGYKLFIQSSIQRLFFEITANSGLQIEDNVQFNRAHAKGIPISERPNTCDKARLIKKIWMLTHNLNREYKWDVIENSMSELNGFFSRMLCDVEQNIAIKNGMEKEEAIKWMGVEWLNFYLNDTLRGYPQAAISYDGLQIPLKKKYLDRAYIGFVLTLQFVYFQLLGQAFYDKSILKDLHDALKIWSGKKYPIGVGANVHTQYGTFYREATPFILANRRFASNNLKRLISTSKEVGMEWAEQKLGEQAEELLPNDKWLAVDEIGMVFFDTLRESDPALQQLFHSIPNNIGYVGKFDISPYLKDTRIPEPDYLSSRDDESKMKRVDASLYWYDLDVLDSQHLHQFNGALPLISLLKGYTQLRMEGGKVDELSIRVFLHPEGVHDDYSFGVLMESYGSKGMGDYSGWLIFFDCSSNYPEKRLLIHQQVESCIRDIRKLIPLDIEKIVIEKELFKKFLVQKSISPVFDTMIVPDEIGECHQYSLPELRKLSKDSFEQAKGKLFEYVFAAMLQKNKPESKIDTDRILLDEQIDVMILSEWEIEIYECKLSIHEDGIEDVVDEIERKMNAAKSYNDRLLIKPVLVVYHAISEERKKFFEQKGIIVVEEYRKIISSDKKYFCGPRNSKRQILSILDYNVDSFFPFG